MKVNRRIKKLYRFIMVVNEQMDMGKSDRKNDTMSFICRWLLIPIVPFVKDFFAYDLWVDHPVICTLGAITYALSAIVCIRDLCILYLAIIMLPKFRKSISKQYNKHKRP